VRACVPVVCALCPVCCCLPGNSDSESLFFDPYCGLSSDTFRLWSFFHTSSIFGFFYRRKELDESSCALTQKAGPSARLVTRTGAKIRTGAKTGTGTALISVEMSAVEMSAPEMITSMSAIRACE